MEKGDKMLEIWVDDERPKPEEYADEAKSVHEALILTGMIIERQFQFKRSIFPFPNDQKLLLDLDHDAGEYVTDGGDYINILKALSQPWFGEMCGELGSKILVRFHSANPVGVQNMREIVEKCKWLEEVK